MLTACHDGSAIPHFAPEMQPQNCPFCIYASTPADMDSGGLLMDQVQACATEFERINHRPPQSLKDDAGGFDMDDCIFSNKELLKKRLVSGKGPDGDGMWYPMKHPSNILQKQCTQTRIR